MPPISGIMAFLYPDSKFFFTCPGDSPCVQTNWVNPTVLQLNILIPFLASKLNNLNYIIGGVFLTDKLGPWIKERKNTIFYCQFCNNIMVVSNWRSAPLKASPHQWFATYVTSYNLQPVAGNCSGLTLNWHVAGQRIFGIMLQVVASYFKLCCHILVWTGFNTST